MNRMLVGIFIIDINKEHIAVKESAKLGIRSFAVTDTNTNPSLVNYPIPGNDDASKAISATLFQKLFRKVFLRDQRSKIKKH